MQLNSIFPRVSGRIVSVKLVWIRGNPGWKTDSDDCRNDPKEILQLVQDAAERTAESEDEESAVRQKYGFYDELHAEVRAGFEIVE